VDTPASHNLPVGAALDGLFVEARHNPSVYIWGRSGKSSCTGGPQNAGKTGKTESNAVRLSAAQNLSILVYTNCKAQLCLGIQLISGMGRNSVK
jgi:hypothetical protein